MGSLEFSCYFGPKADAQKKISGEIRFSQENCGVNFQGRSGKQRGKIHIGISTG
jgi:hypothetical protein